ncbi:hypothetical protein OG613_47410 (plasmid) [Streptomyces sp. NBC_00015]|uniref:hypothetical protein n=1 Tax=Streptomyces sp. NBC_00015 TaxID=2903611 RepID=UPI002F90E0D6
MPNTTLNYDPTTPEGQYIGDLFRGIKGIEDGDGGWNGGDTVNVLQSFFLRLGIDVTAGTYQVDPIPPQAVSPEAEPDTVAELLSAHDDFTTDGDPTGNEGFFSAEPDITDCTLLTFPTASAARIRTALTVLRAAGYTATEPALTTPETTARTIYVDAGVLHPLPNGASITDRATRLLQDAGFTHHSDTGDKAPVVSHTTPTPVDWRPGWVQIDVIAPRTTGRDAREEVARAMAATLTEAGWTVDPRGTETLHTTPPPAEPTPQPAGEPELVPADIIASVHNVVDHFWIKEQGDYEEQDPEGQEHHIANDLNRIAQHWFLDPNTD